MNTDTQDKVVIRLTIYDAPKHSKEFIRKMAEWLRTKADELESIGASSYSNNFTARYLKTGVKNG